MMKNYTIIQIFIYIAPCELPVVKHGVYTAGYRAGLTIAHGSSVALHCEIGFAPPATFVCELGNLKPNNADLCMQNQGINIELFNM